MDDAVLSMADAEEFQFQWITIAADLEEMEATGAIQISELESGGSFSISAVISHQF